MATFSQMKLLVQSSFSTHEPKTFSDELNRQLNDHFDEYDRLEQKYKELQLMNEQYLSHNAFLQSENDELKKHLEEYKAKESTVGDVMNEHRQEMKEVKHQLTQYYIEVIQRLQCQNKELQQQKDEFQAILKNQSKAQQIMKKIHSDTENELKSVKAKYENTDNNNMHMPCTNMVPSMDGYSTSAPSKLYLSKTNSSVQSTWHFNDITAKESNPPSVYFSDYSLNSNASDHETEFEYPEYEEMDISTLKLKMQRIETQNKELMQQMNMDMSVNNDNDEKENKYADDQMFSEEDLDEMEALFRKCDIEKTKQQQKDKWFWIRFKTNKY